MKFYDCVTAPSPRRVRIFLAEKGLTVPTVQVDLRNGEQFTPAFRALNPDCMVPVLELDSGVAITDIIAICRYFEELHPDPPLMGRSAEERAVIESWLRRIEWDGIYAAQEAFRNATPGLKGRALPGPVSLEQIPAVPIVNPIRWQLIENRAMLLLDVRFVPTDLWGGDRSATVARNARGRNSGAEAANQCTAAWQPQETSLWVD